MRTSLKDRIRIIYGKFINIVIIYLMVIVALSLVRNISKMKQTQSLIDEEKQRVESLKREKEDLEKKLQKVHSGEYIEKQLRDNLGLAKSGEIVVILPDESVVRKFAPRHQEEKETLPDPNWRRWAKLFGLI